MLLRVVGCSSSSTAAGDLTCAVGATVSAWTTGTRGRRRISAALGAGIPAGAVAAVGVATSGRTAGADAAGATSGTVAAGTARFNTSF